MENINFGRQNIEGNLEAIPETLQVLPVDNFGSEDAADDVETDNVEASENTHCSLQEKEHGILVKEEHTTELLPNQINEEEILEEQLDTKEGMNYHCFSFHIDIYINKTVVTKKIENS